MNKVIDSKFVTRKQNIFNDQSNTYYDEENDITYHTRVLRSNLCDFNDAHILVRGDITIIGHAETPDNIFTIKNTKIYLSVVTLSARDNQNHQNFLTKDLKDPCVGIDTKQKSENKITKKEFRYFL